MSLYTACNRRAEGASLLCEWRVDPELLQGLCVVMLNLLKQLLDVGGSNPVLTPWYDGGVAFGWGQFYKTVVMAPV